MNPLKMMQLQNAWRQFQRQHPKFTKFLKNVSRDGLKEGSVIEIRVTTAEGEHYVTNLCITKEDMELMKKVRNL